MVDTFQFLIGGVDYTNYVDFRSVHITESMQVRGFTCQMDVIISNNAIAAPTGGQLVQVYCGSRKDFAGRIDVVDQTQIGVINDQRYKLQCVDFSVDLDMTVLRPNLYPSQAAGDILRQVIGACGRGFTSNNVANGVTVNQQLISYDTPSSLIQRLADSTEYHWYIDYDRDLNFFFLRDRPAPIGTISVDSDLQVYSDLTWTQQWAQVKNYLYLTNAKVRSTNFDNISQDADGQQRFFPLNYEPFSLADVVVTIDGVVQALFLDGITSQAGDGGSQVNTAYVCIDNWGVRFPDGAPPALGAAVVIESLYAYEPVVVVADTDSIARMALIENVAGAPSIGQHEFKFDVPELRVINFDTIFEYGQLLLLRYSNIIYTANFKSYVQGWAPGQYFQLTSAADKRNINDVMYVTRVSKTIRMMTPVALWDYEIEASSTPLPG